MHDQAESQAGPPATPARGPILSVALQVMASAMIAFVLVAGPQVEPLWDRVKQVWSRTPAPAPAARPAKAPKVQPLQAQPPQVQATQVRAPQIAPQAPPSQSQAAQRSPAPPAATPYQPAPAVQAQPKPAPPVAAAQPKPKGVSTPRAPFAQVLIEPKQPDVKVSYATLMQEGYELYRSGWYGPAMGRFKQATQIRPNSVTAFLWMGRAALKVGRIAEARQALEHVITMAPGSEAAREAKALLGTFE